MKKMLLAGVAGLVVLSAAPALAQTAQPATQPQVIGGDIIVTAQRDRSLLSKTPLAITAVTGDALRSAGVTGPSALADVAPSISIDHTDGLQITIRGVTSNDQTEKGDPSAAFMLDGVYIARTQEADVSFFDVDRVEVLRGPQGTLYGRNTTAGVVNVLTNKPQLDKFSASVDAAYGNYNAASVQGAINVPLSPIMALRVAGDYDRHDNYINLAPGDTAKLSGPQRNNYAGRAQLLIEPSASFNLLLRASYAKIKGLQAAIDQGGIALSTFYNSLPSGATAGQSNPVWAGPSATAAMTRQNLIPATPGIDGNGANYGENNTSYALEGEANWNTGPVTVTDITSYHHFKRNETAVADLGAGAAFPDAFNGTYHQISEELRVSTNGTGPFHLQAGGYYFREKEDIDLSLFGLLGPAGSNYYVYGFPQMPVINRTWGVFTQGTYKPIPQIRLTAGVRYTNDYKYRYGHTVVLPTPSTSLSQNLGYVNDASIKAHHVTWRAAIDGDVPTGLLFASVATGYKAGGFGDGCSTGAAGQSNKTSEGESCVYGQPYQTGAIFSEPAAVYYQPETLTAYEVGYKGKFAGGMVRLNLDAFYYDYKNMQLSGVVEVDGAPSTVTTNAGKAHIKGIEVETIIAPDHHNRLTFGLDLLDARYVQYCPHSTTSGACDDNWAGRQLDRSPSLVARAAYTYTVPVGEGRIDATAGTKLQTKSYVTAYTTYPIQYVTPWHTTTDLTLTYHAPGDRWYLQGFGKNLENFISVNGVNTFGFVTALGEPRTYGVRAGMKF